MKSPACRRRRPPMPRPVPATRPLTRRTAPSPSIPSEAPLKFAQCMREHGIDMPDPTISEDGGGVMIADRWPRSRPRGDAPDPKELEAANKECQHFMEDAMGAVRASERGGPEEDAGAGARVRQVHARPRHRHARPAVLGRGGAFSIGVSAGPDSTGPVTDGPLIDFDSDEFQEASEACGGPGGGGFAISTKPADG